ncbi:hypothetical protein SH1V18_38410 [Vallitalea longa]|uniref:Uncharacterized protein n=1 Tax=Vallitalea longa TaxID=2936439 RepID=A0A9W5YER6_9FIRM|nr:hypothetical protein [Vallitalea longa]GKX31361.1 hypothetical protein SH1V18_38410 [Vallitalea longa]
MSNVDLKILNGLTDKDIKTLCKNADLNDMLEPIKRNEKHYSQYRSQLGRMDKKSILVQKNLPKFAFKLYKKGDMNYLKFFAITAMRMKMVLESIIHECMGEEIQLEDVKNYSIYNYKKLFIQIIKSPNSSLDLDLFFLQLKISGVDVTQKMKENIRKEWNSIQEIESMRKKILDTQKEEMKKKEDELQKEIAIQKENLKSKIRELETEVQSLNSHINSKEKIIVLLKEENENLHNELRQQKGIVASKGNEIKDLRRKLEKTQLNLDDITIKLQMKIRDIYGEIENTWQEENEAKLKEKIELERIVVEMKESFKELEAKKEQLKSKVGEWEGYIEDYFVKMDQKVIEHKIESLLYESGCKRSMEIAATSENTPKSGALYIQKGYKAKELEEFTDYEDYIDVVETNLSNAGDKMPVGTMYDSFNAAIGAGLCPLLCGFGARQLALALTAARYGEKSEIISIPVGFNNINELASAISDSQTYSVIVEDAFGTMNENTLLPILRNVNEKIVVFTAESNENLRYLQKHFYNYIQLIVSTKRKNVKKHSLVYSDADILFKKRIYTWKEPGNKLSKKILEHIGMSNSYVVTRGNVLCELLAEDKNNSEDDALYKLIETELKWIIDEDQYDKLVDLIQGNEDRYSEKLIECVVR